MGMELGGRGVDTAWEYFDQRPMMEAIAAAGVAREDVFIISKVPNCTNTVGFLEEDFRELQTDVIDLMLLHSPHGGDCNEAWAVLEDYLAKGRLRAIGISNFRRNHIEALMRTAVVKPAVNQIKHSVLNHSDDTIAASQERGILIQAFSPLGRGGHADLAHHPTIVSIADGHGVTSYQVAIRWILQHGHLLTFQSVSKAHQAVDADVFSFHLSDDEMELLDSLQTRQRAHAYLSWPLFVLALTLVTCVGAFAAWHCRKSMASRILAESDAKLDASL